MKRMNYVQNIWTINVTINDEIKYIISILKSKLIESQGNKKHYDSQFWRLHAWKETSCNYRIKYQQA
jgi:hypothetical protein